MPSRVKRYNYDVLKPLVWLLLVAGGSWLLSVTTGTTALVILIVAISLSRLLRSTLVAFFFAGLFGAMIAPEQSPYTYTTSLAAHAGDDMMLLILIFSGVVALLRRQDLIGDEPHHGRSADDPQRSAFCLFERLVRYQGRLRQPPAQTTEGNSGTPRQRGASWCINQLLAFGITCALALLGFASSVVAVKVFKSVANAANTGNVKNPQASRQDLAAFVPLCLCTSGALLVFVSPWWLFFESSAHLAVSSKPWSDPTLWPVAAWLFALVSLVHGHLRLPRSVDVEAPNSSEINDTKKRYAIALVGCCFLAAMALVFNQWSSSPPDKPELANLMNAIGDFSAEAEVADEAESVSARAVESLIVGGRNVNEALDAWVEWAGTQAGWTALDSTTTKRLAATVGIMAIAVLLVAQSITLGRKETSPGIQGLRTDFRAYVKNLRDLGVGLAGDVLSGVGVIAIIAVVLAFRDVLQGEVERIYTLESWTLFTALGDVLTSVPVDLRILVLLLLMSVLGWFLGSSFGVFAIGMLLLSGTVGVAAGGETSANTLAQLSWATDSLIVVAAFSNQWSPASDNRNEAMRDVRGQEQLPRPIFVVQLLLAVGCVVAARLYHL